MENQVATNNPAVNPVETTDSGGVDIGQLTQAVTGSNPGDVASVPEPAPAEVPAETPVESVPVETEVDKTGLEADERFKGDANKLYESYKEMESKLGETASKAKIAERLAEQSNMSIEEMNNYLDQQQSGSVGRPSSDNARPASAYEDPQVQAAQYDVLDKLNSLEQKMALQEEESEINALIKEVPDAVNFKDAIRDIGRSKVNMSHKEIYKTYLKPAVSTGKDAAFQKLSSKEQSQPESTSQSQATPIQTGALTPESMQGLHENPERMAQVEADLRKKGLI